MNILINFFVRGVISGLAFGAAIGIWVGKKWSEQKTNKKKE